MFGISFKTKPVAHFEVGTEVEANYNNKGKWMEGSIIEVREDGTFDVEFKNGRKENSIPLKRLKPMNQSAYQSGVASPQVHGAGEHHSDHDDDNASVHSAHSTTDHHHKPTKRGSMTDYFHAFTHSSDSHTAASPIDKAMELYQAPIDTSVILEVAEEANETDLETTVKIRKKLNKTSMKHRIKCYRESSKGALDISELDLDQIPVGLFTNFLDTIKILNVSRNILSSLSNTGYFLNLTHLDLSHNGLTDLAGLNLYSLKGLKWVDLSWNKLTEISGELTSLSQVESLILAHNDITGLPSQDHFAVMKGLARLDLSYNKLFSVTDELELLPRLDDLNLSHNMSEFYRGGSMVSVETVFVDTVGGRTKRLLEKKALYGSKETRRSLVKNALDMQRKVIIKEQEVRYNELQASRQSSKYYNKNSDDVSVGQGSTTDTVEIDN